MMYNANLDKSHSQRKSLAELRADLKNREEQLRTSAKSREKGREKEWVGEDVIGYQVCLYSMAWDDLQWRLTISFL